MAVHDARVNLIINHGRQMGRSLLLLGHYAATFLVFVGRTAQWLVNAVKWTSLFAHYTTSAFDSVYRYLRWGKRRNREARDAARSSSLKPQ